MNPCTYVKIQISARVLMQFLELKRGVEKRTERPEDLQRRDSGRQIPRKTAMSD